MVRIAILTPPLVHLSIVSTCNHDRAWPLWTIRELWPYDDGYVGQSKVLACPKSAQREEKLFDKETALSRDPAYPMLISL
jgi:hypothetical protein